MVNLPPEAAVIPSLFRLRTVVRVLRHRLWRVFALAISVNRTAGNERHIPADKFSGNRVRSEDDQDPPHPLTNLFLDSSRRKQCRTHSFGLSPRPYDCSNFLARAGKLCRRRTRRCAIILGDRDNLCFKVFERVWLLSAMRICSFFALLTSAFRSDDPAAIPGRPKRGRSRPRGCPIADVRPPCWATRKH